jgi:hypothetical protein
MIRPLLFLLGVALPTLSTMAQADTGAPTMAASDAAVCFWDFRSESPVAKGEKDMDSARFCRYAIDRQAFLKLLSPRPASEGYMPGYVRAKIMFGPGDVYFIDNSGIVRRGNQKFAIDKDAFSAAVKELKKLPPPAPWKPCHAGCGK